MHGQSRESRTPVAETDDTGRRCQHIIATRSPTMASWFLLGFLVFVQLWRSLNSIGANTWTSSSSFSHMNSFKVSVALLRRMETVLSEQICAISRCKDRPKPFTIKFWMIQSLRHLLAKAHQLPLASGSGLQSLLRLGVMMYDLGWHL